MTNYRTAFILALGVAVEMMAVAAVGQVHDGRQFQHDVDAMHACRQVLQPTRALRIIVAPRKQAPQGQFSV